MASSARSISLSLLFSLAACGDDLGQLELKMSEPVTANLTDYDVHFDLLSGTDLQFSATNTVAPCSTFDVVTTQQWEAGNRYTLVPGGASGVQTAGHADIASVVYSEGCTAGSTAQWWSSYGTFVLDELIGAHADIHFDYVAMVAAPQTTATGTFNLTGRGTSDTVVLP